MENVQIIVISEDTERVPELLCAIACTRPEWRIFRKYFNDLTQEIFDSTAAVIIDADLPKYEVIRIINFLNSKCPDIFKFLWADGSKTESLKTILAEIPKHQPACLWKQQSASVIADTISRTIFFADWIRFKQISNTLWQMRDIPTIPFVYLRALNLLNDVNCDAEDVANCIAEDPSLCAMILKLANSAIIGLREPVSTPFEAVMHLGMERIKAFILTSGFATQFDQQKIPWFSIERFWQHSMMVASYARQIAIAYTNDVKFSDTCFTSGILHDVGILLIASNKSDEYKEILSTALSNNNPLHVAEKIVLGFTHAELAACLLCLWGLPLSILESVASHHNPRYRFSSEFSPLTAVHVANAFANEKCFDNYRPGDTFIDEEYLKTVDCFSELQNWKNICFD